MNLLKWFFWKVPFTLTALTLAYWAGTDIQGQERMDVIDVFELSTVLYLFSILMELLVIRVRWAFEREED
jgi:hypothetical protein